MSDIKPYYLHLSIWKIPDQASTYRMEFWTNDTTANAQNGSWVRNFPITKWELPSGTSHVDGCMGMKKMMENGYFDSILVMGNLTVKDLRMLGVEWRK